MDESKIVRKLCSQNREREITRMSWGAGFSDSEKEKNVGIKICFILFKKNNKFFLMQFSFFLV